MKLLVQTKYREYIGLGSKATRKTIRKEDNLDKKDMER